MARDAVLNLRVPVEVKEALRRAATDDHDRSLSAMAGLILAQWLVDHRYLTEKRPAPKRKMKARK
jgi:hypothetical protein